MGTDRRFWACGGRRWVRDRVWFCALGCRARACRNRRSVPDGCRWLLNGHESPPFVSFRFVGALHVGLILPNYGDALDPEHLAAVAVAAEAAGFDSGWVTDHVMVPAELAPVYGTIAEALVSLAFLAGRTRRLQLGVSALIVPQRNPFVTLKQVTSLDFLSGGRVLMAVAAGWLEKEFETLSVPFEGRGRRLDDWLELGRLAFAQMPGPVEHVGRLRTSDGWLAPGLVRPEGIEIWVAGVSDATLRRAGQTGVWHPVALPLAELSELAMRFRERREDGRVVLRLSTLFADRPEPRRSDERGRHAVAGPPHWIAERLAEYVNAGCNGFVVNLGHDAPGLEERVQRFAEEVWPAVVRSV
jgi:alkanesulfonate monooxygenase SsuD/methylene tetrahydromethanopterin reductase-like flavin-dependent oxidoreductase (luciferase family)